MIDVCPNSEQVLHTLELAFLGGFDKALVLLFAFLWEVRLGLLRRSVIIVRVIFGSSATTSGRIRGILTDVAVMLPGIASSDLAVVVRHRTCLCACPADEDVRRRPCAPTMMQCVMDGKTRKNLQERQGYGGRLTPNTCVTYLFSARHQLIESKTKSDTDMYQALQLLASAAVCLISHRRLPRPHAWQTAFHTTNTAVCMKSCKSYLV